MLPIHINFDNAWNPASLPMRTIDALPFGPTLRYTAPESEITRAFKSITPQLTNENFFLYGSGDYHYLAAWFLKHILARPENAALKNITLVSFDNHPDWDIRPPRWACGSWINRALEIPQINRASIWGCGNFELAFPSRLFRNKKALANGTLEIHAWAERQSPATARRFNCMTRDNWRDRFTTFAKSLANSNVYLTLDLDALDRQHALTNWENGLFTPDDITWAITELRTHTHLLAADCCGAFSPPTYARPIQRFIGNFDHPKIPTHTIAEAQSLNHHTLAAILPSLNTS